MQFVHVKNISGKNDYLLDAIFGNAKLFSLHTFSLNPISFTWKSEILHLKEMRMLEESDSQVVIHIPLFNDTLKSSRGRNILGYSNTVFIQ